MKTMRKKYYVCNLYISIHAQIGMSFVLTHSLKSTTIPVVFTRHH